MTHKIHLRLRRGEGALARVLGRLRRRGMNIGRVVVRAGEDGLDVVCTVEGERSAHVLSRFLTKLLDSSAQVEQSA
ncbi:MAG: hypothetical protein HYY16_19785 [Planctomycetes bacterium]|nr:hypothetical protein [Planctomycetota bacterium]